MEQLRRNTIAWLERTNPLRGLSISRAGSIFDSARVWGSPRLQYMYNEIEATDPVLMTCVERRAAAIAGLQRQFVAISGSDEVLANEQRDALSRFAAQIDNFDDALERLDEAFFRGYCHLQPIWDGDTVPHVNFLNSWNFMRDDTGRWLWNPLCHETIHGLGDVKGARLVSLVRRRAIDYPAIFIYIRKALGERDYGRFMERHGIPHAAIFMAPGTQEQDVPKYLSAASAWSNGQDSVFPSEARIELATEARAADPFTPFVEHQDKYIVLLATGGTLTSLAQADTGSLAGGAQMDVWREIVTRDGALIADALNRGLFQRYLERAFPGRPVAAEFRLSNEKKASAAEVADLAGKLKAAGWSIDQDELQEAVGYTLVKDETGAAGMPPQRGGGIPAASYAPFGNRGRDCLNRVTNKGGSSTSDANETFASTGDRPLADESALAAFAKDTGPAAEAVKALLKDPSDEAAKALMANLDGLLPDDPALAAVIAEEMAKAFTVDAAPSPRQENKGNQQRVPSGNGNGGQFTGATNQPDGGTAPAEDDTHTPEEKKRIAEYQASTDQKVVDFVERMKNADNHTRNNSWVDICPVNTRMTDRIKDLTGVDTTDWTIELQGNHVKHIDNRHGGRGQQDSSMAAPETYARLGYVMSNFDSIEILKDKRGNPVKSEEYKGSNNKPSPVVNIRMKIDSTVAVQEAVPDTKMKKLRIVSARIEKS